MTAALIDTERKRSGMSEDLIRRSDAIKAMEELPNAYNGWSDAYDKAYIIGTLEEVPSADRPQGEWIDEHEDGHGSWVGTCNQCNKENRVDNFCPHCGAEMKGTDDE